MRKTKKKTITRPDLTNLLFEKRNEDRLALGPAPLISCSIHVVHAVPKFQVDDLVKPNGGNPFVIFQIRIESVPDAPHRYTAYYREAGKRRWFPQVVLTLLESPKPSSASK